jgi:hypothetical protein
MWHHPSWTQRMSKLLKRSDLRTDCSYGRFCMRYQDAWRLSLFRFSFRCTRKWFIGTEECKLLDKSYYSISYTFTLLFIQIIPIFNYLLRYRFSHCVSKWVFRAVFDLYWVRFPTKARDSRLQNIHTCCESHAASCSTDTWVPSSGNKAAGACNWPHTSI